MPKPMLSLVSAIPARDARSGLVHVIIDTPRGSANKYKLDESSGLYKVSRILPAGMHFPYDFGSVPGTCAEDGDPLDVLVLMDAPTFPGCLVTTRLIGGLRMQQKEKRRTLRNDRLIAVPITPVNPAPIRSLRSLSDDRLREIEAFFVSYNRVQGREVKITSRIAAGAAEKLLTASMRAYEKEAQH